jgi:hypothetical protein
MTRKSVRWCNPPPRSPTGDDGLRYHDRSPGNAARRHMDSREDRDERGAAAPKLLIGRTPRWRCIPVGKRVPMGKCVSVEAVRSRREMVARRCLAVERITTPNSLIGRTSPRERCMPVGR